MFDRAAPQPQSRAPRVLLVADGQVNVRVTRQGERYTGQPCQLTISINGGEAISFLEDAGSDAPRAAVVDLTAPDMLCDALMDALRTKPWLHSDTPIIPYSLSDRIEARQGPREIGYLVRNQPITDVIDAIRDTLDLTGPTA